MALHRVYTVGFELCYSVVLLSYHLDVLVSMVYHKTMNTSSPDNKDIIIRTVRLNSADRELLIQIRDAYGLRSESEALRLALRVTVKQLKKKKT